MKASPAPNTLNTSTAKPRPTIPPSKVSGMAPGKRHAPERAALAPKAPGSFRGSLSAPTAYRIRRRGCESFLGAHDKIAQRDRLLAAAPSPPHWRRSDFRPCPWRQGPTTPGGNQYQTQRAPAALASRAAFIDAAKTLGRERCVPLISKRARARRIRARHLLRSAPCRRNSRDKDQRKRIGVADAEKHKRGKPFGVRFPRLRAPRPRAPIARAGSGQMVIAHARQQRGGKPEPRSADGRIG